MMTSERASRDSGKAKVGRRLRYQVAVTLDGFIAGPNGEYDWIVPDPAVDFGALYKQFDTAIMGRKTYEVGIAQGENITMPGIEIIVFSRTLKDVHWKNSRIISKFDPRQVESIKNEPGKDIMIFGSGTIASQLAQANLIDEYQFVVGPVMLGDGRTLISGVSKTQRLDLVEAKPFKNGNVMLRFAARK